MAREVTVTPSRTYATRENAIKAVNRVYSPEDRELRYIIVANEHGRWYPVFLGTYAVQCGAHFHFCVVS